MKIKRFPQSKKFRVISGNVSFYATAKQIRYGVGDLSTFNGAIQKALDSLEFYRSGTGIESACTGHAGTWNGIEIQLNIA